MGLQAVAAGVQYPVPLLKPTVMVGLSLMKPVYCALAGDAKEIEKAPATMAAADEIRRFMSISSLVAQYGEILLSASDPASAMSRRAYLAKNGLRNAPGIALRHPQRNTMGSSPSGSTYGRNVVSRTSGDSWELVSRGHSPRSDRPG